MPLALTVRTMDGKLANDRSRGEEAAKESMPPEYATKETANQEAQPVFLNTTQRPGARHVENCPQSEESREETMPPQNNVHIHTSAPIHTSASAFPRWCRCP